QTQDADRPDETPILPTPTPEQVKHKAKLEADIAALDKRLNQATAELDAAQKRWEGSKNDKLPANIKAILGVAAPKRNAAQKAELAKYYRAIAPELKKEREQAAALKKQL